VKKDTKTARKTIKKRCENGVNVQGKSGKKTKNGAQKRKQTATE
jgi:hypothetical protein